MLLNEKMREAEIEEAFTSIDAELFDNFAEAASFALQNGLNVYYWDRADRDRDPDRVSAWYVVARGPVEAMAFAAWRHNTLLRPVTTLDDGVDATLAALSEHQHQRQHKALLKQREANAAKREQRIFYDVETAREAAGDLKTFKQEVDGEWVVINAASLSEAQLIWAKANEFVPLEVA